MPDPLEVGPTLTAGRQVQSARLLRIGGKEPRRYGIDRATGHPIALDAGSLGGVEEGGGASDVRVRIRVAERRHHQSHGSPQ